MRSTLKKAVLFRLNEEWELKLGDFKVDDKYFVESFMCKNIVEHIWS